jgi:flagellar L-ring protein FlgH
MKLGHAGLASLMVFNLGCASVAQKWKELISGRSPEADRKAALRPEGPTYSDQSQLAPNQYRQYRRTTRKNLQDQSHLDSRAGSLWVMEGQGAYLFAQNVVRMVGDPIGVNIEGDPKDQLTQKSQVISSLLKNLEERRKRAAAKNEDGAPTEAPPQAAGDAGAGGGAAARNPASTAAAAAAPGTDKDFQVKTVPTRIVERLVDGNYRVRGSQPFMIGSREYKVIVSGIVKAEDFNDEGISATQLLDPSFDIVSSKSTEIR